MSTKSKYRLVYFNVRALAEPIRWIFEYTGTPYVDERIPWDYPTWFSSIKKNYSCTVGQIPVLYEDDKPLGQSQVISRYLAKKFNLTGDNDWEDAKIDEAISLVFDLFIWRTTKVMERDPERRKELTIKVGEKFQLYYAKFNQILEESGGDFVMGKKLTHADFWLASFVSIWDDPMTGDIFPVMLPGLQMPTEADLYVDLTKGFPALRKHKERITSIPPIKEWIQKRPKTIL